MKSPHSRGAAFRYPAASEPLREAFLRRSWEAIARIAAHADPQILAEALAAPTDVGALARVLGDPAAIGASVVDLDPLAPLAARNAEHRSKALAAAGGALSSTEAARTARNQPAGGREAPPRQRASCGASGRRLAISALPIRRSGGEVVAGLPKLLGAFARAGPWVALDFLLAPDEALGGETPLQVLRREGLTPALERLARIEQGDGFA